MYTGDSKMCVCVCVRIITILFLIVIIIIVKNIKEKYEYILMAQARRDILENLFFNIIMNMQDDAVFFHEEEHPVINQSLYESNPIKMVISEEEKAKLSTIKYKDALNKEQNTTCFITQDDFQEEDDVIQLPCHHCFTPDSIMQWLTEECAECPVCRYKFESVEKRVVVDSSLNNVEVEEEMPELIPIHQRIDDYNYSIIGAIDEMSEVNNFRDIFLNNIFNSFSNESNIMYNFLEIDDNEEKQNDDNENDVD